MKVEDANHVIILESGKNGVCLTDPQTGKSTRSRDKIKKIIDQIDYSAKNSPRMLRIDNLCPNTKVMNVVLKKAGGSDGKG